ncbi:MAG TPA: DoxX family protein [Acidimicrobiales bacterium]|nr:DoxX family protein [Acidimicrobiales bacterium]
MIARQSQARDLYSRLSGIREARNARDLALLAVRVGLAWIFIYNGAAKLFGWFGGGGLHQSTQFFANVAHLHPAGFFSALAGVIEFFGAIGVGIGILGRLAALALAGDMVVAMATVTWGNGIASNAPGQGYALNIALLTMAVGVALMGTGRFSLDEALRRMWLSRRSSAVTRSPAAGAPAAGGA